MSVVFDLNASLIDVAPMSLMLLLSVVLMRMGKSELSELLMDAICVLFLLSSQPRSSSVSVVFDFNASLNDAAPVHPISLTVCLMRMKKEWIIGGCYIRVVSFVFTIQI